MKPQYLSLGGGRSSVFMLLLAVLLALNSCKDSDNVTNPNPNPHPNPGEERNVLETLQSDDEYKTLVELLESTSLATTLSGTGKVTIFAPTEEAFAKLDAGYIGGLSDDQKLELLKYHLYSGSLLFGDTPILDTEMYESVQGEQIYIRHVEAEKLINNSALVTTANVEASNGVIHSIDRLLLPDSFGTILDNMKKRFDYEELLEMVNNLGLEQALEAEGNYSFFAPATATLLNLEDDLNWNLSDEEWTDILKYHIVNEDISGVGPGTRTRLISMSGDSLFLTMQTEGEFRINFDLVSNSIQSKNGYVYNLEGVLLPDKYVNIMTLMDKRYDVTTIRSAFAVARLTGTLYDLDDEFTIFAPKNNVPGFGSLPGDEASLAEALKYHVLPIKLMADQLQDGGVYTTLNGESITIIKSGDTITINGNTLVTRADLVGRNGVVHIVNRVLTPPTE